MVAILGKTEGNGCVNDFTRAYAVQALSHMLARRLGSSAEAIQARIALVMSGGTEGGLSPHFLVLAVEAGEAPAPGGALAIGTAFTADFAPEQIGRMAQVTATAAAVRAAMAEAGITDPAEVHYVQVKCPLLTSERMAAARARGADGGDGGYLCLDGPVARCLGARRRAGAGRAGAVRMPTSVRTGRSSPAAPAPRPGWS